LRQARIKELTDKVIHCDYEERKEEMLRVERETKLLKTKQAKEQNA